MTAKLLAGSNPLKSKVLSFMVAALSDGEGSAFPVLGSVGDDVADGLRERNVDCRSPFYVLAADSKREVAVLGQLDEDIEDDDGFAESEVDDWLDDGRC